MEEVEDQETEVNFTCECLECHFYTRGLIGIGVLITKTTLKRVLFRRRGL